ncbi:MAG TPA: homoserine dehydrogenase, partial [Actinomycetales bacterium]|nr:homoserine dehydrogenase [Actinomycetales bacterium]
RVHPALVPNSHPLASVDGAFNAVFIESQAAGPLMFYGQGAGGAPTASAVVGDLVSAGRHRVLGGTGPRRSSYAEIPILPSGEVRTHFQLRLRVVDEPGVLAQVSQSLAEQSVSIETVRQILDKQARDEASRNGTEKPTAALVVTTHEASEAALAATVEALENLDVVTEIVSILRVEGA